MTETASSAAARKGKAAEAHGVRGRRRPGCSRGKRRGLTMSRIYTTPGVHPYDAGHLGAPRRRHDQLAGRLGQLRAARGRIPRLLVGQRRQHRDDQVLPRRGRHPAAGVEPQAAGRPRGRKYEQTGRQNGYFATAEDAEIFDHELTYALIHQIFASTPRSGSTSAPASPQQVSACFILAVDDTMDSILDWYREEGLIFKGGSGAGVNLSRIRSSKELLSSGGTASGPVSFMRGADASAGTIKSGGATRRAAKMVVLDVDHPDVEEFIATKAREEEKIRVLRDAGFDMDLGGQDIISVQYQNANNSVRVSDEFMRAVEETARASTCCARRTGEVIERVEARELLRKMAQAAWDCADPGIQYDDTINDWHTNPESGRITASNPCTEYLSLDNSSCNLASINLLKFLREDDTFDASGSPDDRGDHHRDGHLDHVRRLPDREDRRDHPGLPAARHRLRQPGRAADGHRPRLRLRWRPGYRRGHHLADDRDRLQDGPPSSPRSSGPTTATSATPRRTSGSSASTPRPARTSAGRLHRAAHPRRWPDQTWQECVQLGEANGYRNAQA